MQQIFLSGINVDDLVEKITQVIETKFDLLSKTKFVKPDLKYVSRFEVARMLKISLPTLHDWTNLGRLKAYKIGRRVLYKADEIDEAITKISNLKFRKSL